MPRIFIVTIAHKHSGTDVKIDQSHFLVPNINAKFPSGLEYWFCFLCYLIIVYYEELSILVHLGQYKIYTQFFQSAS